jgi:hypothetical protein
VAFQVVAQVQIVGQSQVFLEEMTATTHKIEKDLEATTNFEEFQVLQLEEMKTATTELEEFQVLQFEEMKFAAATTDNLEATTELEEFQVLQLEEMKFAATTTENFATIGSFFYVYILMTEKYYQICDECNDNNSRKNE